MQNYAAGLLTGPDAPLACDAPPSGFLLLGPDTDYPAHSHMPREIYLVLTPGREGIKHYYLKIASKRPGRKEWRPIHLFECGNFVILHKLLPSTVIVDIMRFNHDDQLAEHWDVVQRHPEPDYDPMKLSEENLGRFSALFAL